MSEIILVNVVVDYHDESIQVCVLAEDGQKGRFLIHVHLVGLSVHQ